MESTTRLTPKQVYDKARYEKHKQKRNQQNKDLAARMGPEQWRERTRGYQRKYATGHTEEVWSEMRFNQRGLCAICKVLMNDEERMYQECADHCHTTGRARGLLCRACNLSLGLYEKFQRPSGLRMKEYEEYLIYLP